MGGAWLLMEWIEGFIVRVILEKWETWMRKVDKKEQEENRVRHLLKRIGATVGGLHRSGVVHGDLTTSNLMLRPVDEQTSGYDEENPSMDGEVVPIDFGLASRSVQDEDQAVDLYVLERAIGSTHPRTEPFFGDLLQGYRENYKGSNAVLRRLEDVRMRGRKRSMVG